MYHAWCAVGVWRRAQGLILLCRVWPHADVGRVDAYSETILVGVFDSVGVSCWLLLRRQHPFHSAAGRHFPRAC